MKNDMRKERNEELYRAILTLETVEECMRFFDDLCSVNELKAIEQRYQVASLLHEGKVYTEILEKTGASSATISRVKRNILDSRSGGAMKALIARQGLIEEE